MSGFLTERESFLARCQYDTPPDTPVFDSAEREALLDEAAEDACNNGGVLPADTHARLAEAGFIVLQ